MVVNKYAPKIIIALMAAAVALCLLAVVSSDKLSEKLDGKTVGMEYETELFDTSEIISIDILMDEDDWNEMLSNAIAEEYYKCDVVVNGTKFSNVAIRPKGNTSLSSIAMDPDSERYSFKLEFGHYVDGQTCFGLDKLILNNNYADATNMKEAVVYDMGGGGFNKPSGDSDRETPENGSGGFDPNNMPDMGDGSSNPFGTPPNGNMPDMGDFNLGSVPGGSSDSAQESEDSSKQPPSFSGAPDRPDGMSGMSNMKNLITYGICLAAMLAALILATRFRRRR